MRKEIKLTGPVNIPGPWSFIVENGNRILIDDPAEGAIPIAEMVLVKISDKDITNANLLASAPDLIRSLQKCITPLERYSAPGAETAFEVIGYLEDLLTEIGEVAKAAISKALRIPVE